MLDWNVNQDDELLQLIKQQHEDICEIMEPQVCDHDIHGNEMDRIDRSFHKLCTWLEAAGVSNPKKLSYYEFQVKIDYFEELKLKNPRHDE